MPTYGVVLHRTFPLEHNKVDIVCFVPRWKLRARTRGKNQQCILVSRSSYLSYYFYWNRHQFLVDVFFFKFSSPFRSLPTPRPPSFSSSIVKILRQATSEHIPPSLHLLFCYGPRLSSLLFFSVRPLFLSLSSRSTFLQRVFLFCSP